MQVFKRVKNTKRAQNLIEFVFVFPLLIFMVLVMFEVALFWQDVNAIYSLNQEINASVATLDYKGLSMDSVCPAADESDTRSAIYILKQKDSSISLNDPEYQTKIVDGAQPFALYHFVGGNSITSSTLTKVNSDGTKTSTSETSPQIQLWVDCRNPFENGVTTQLEFYHKTLVISATIPNFSGGPGIEVIPKNIFIASPKLNTIRHY